MVYLCDDYNGPFDAAQGSLTKASASVDAFHPVTFATRIASQFLNAAM